MKNQFILFFKKKINYFGENYFLHVLQKKFKKKFKKNIC